MARIRWFVPDMQYPWNDPAIPKRRWPQTFVYWVRGANDEILYIGKTGHPSSRCQNHSRKPWWPLVRSIEYEEYPMDHLALNAEREAIHREHPPFNVRSRIALEART